MAKTATEDLIKRLRRSSRSSDILVPMIESFSRRPIEISGAKDRTYLQQLIEARSRPRTPGIYSPSMLASCVRQVYLHKTKFPKRPTERIETSSFFLNGNFMHFKWQFLIWKMHQKKLLELVEVPEENSPARGAEIFVCNDRGDYGGTIDNLIWLPKRAETFAIDWKSMNGNAFMRAIAKGPSLNYIIQLVGYAALANAYLDLKKKITHVIIIGENKNGPVMNRRSPSPMGLHEWVFPIDEYIDQVSKRLKKLRSHERKEKQPEIECTTTKNMQFKSCPFAYHCRTEVEAVEKERRNQAALKPKMKPTFTTERVNGKKSSSGKGSRERPSYRRQRPK